MSDADAISHRKPKQKEKFSLVLVYVIMGLLNYYQQVTILVANNDMGINIANDTIGRLDQTLPTPSSDNNLGVLLMVQYIPEIFEEITTEIFGKTTTKKLIASAICSVFGYLLILYGHNMLIRYLGVATMSYSVSCSFTALANHMNLFSKRLLNAYAFGTQSAYICAPGIYMLSRLYLPFLQCIILVAVIPTFQLGVYFFCLRKLELDKIKMAQKPKYPPKKTASILDKYQGNWRLLGPQILVLFFYVYTSQELFRYLPSVGKGLSTSFNFRMYNAILAAGHFFGVVIGLIYRIQKTWFLLILQLFPFVMLLSGVITQMNPTEIIVNIIFKGMVGGYSQTCIYFALQENGDLSIDSAVVDLKLIKQTTQISGIFAGTGILLSVDTIDELRAISELRSINEFSYKMEF